ncbi:MAG: hypothetical protein N4A71_10815 [Carboxylicivirga sp.]|jgi:hypothetical protein|nr:hypothetical protein [Carboxylicivirga sp.]
MKKYLLWSLNLFVSLGFMACNDDNDPKPDKEPKYETITENSYHLLSVIDKAYYMAETQGLSEGDLSFVNNGYQLDANLAARIIGSGEYLYSLNYGSGLLTQMKPNGEDYDVIKEINAGLAVGTDKPRYKLADDKTIMVYNVTAEPIVDEASGNIVDYTCTLRMVSVEIPSMTITNLTEFVIPQSDNAKLGDGYYPTRVDGAVISGDKIYFGLMHTSNLDLIPPLRKPKQTGLETLVFDYPSMSNGKIAESSKAAGHTSGYRAPSMHVDEKGDVYQVNWFMAANSFDLSAGDKTVISRLKGGQYDDSYLFNVSEKLGLESNIASVGWFYVGNGIGYMPIQIEDEGNYYSDNSWVIARVDVYNQTAVKLNVPMSSMFTCENGIVANDKFHLAISPIGGEANVYEFDPTSDSADGFTKGLTLDGGNVSVVGIYMTQIEKEVEVTE